MGKIDDERAFFSEAWIEPPQRSQKKAVAQRSRIITAIATACASASSRAARTPCPTMSSSNCCFSG